MYNQMFNYNESVSGLGYAAAIAWMLALIIFLVTAFQFLLASRWVHYDGALDNGRSRFKRGRGQHA